MATAIHSQGEYIMAPAPDATNHVQSINSLSQHGNKGKKSYHALKTDVL